MNNLLLNHGCSNVFSLPEGLKELMADISREVLREQPQKIFDFIANYLSVLILTREHGILAVKILDDLCDCKPTVSEHLMALGIERKEAELLAQVIKEEIEGFQPGPGREKVKEAQIVKKILLRSVLDEDMTARVCQVARDAFRDYWYRKKLLENSLKVQPDEPWEIAAQRTLELYKKTKPSFSEMTRATEKIQAAYRGYYVRKNLLSHLKPKPKKTSPKVDILGPPVDIAESREIDFGAILEVKVQEDDVNTMFNEYAGEQVGLAYDPMKTITHVDTGGLADQSGPKTSRQLSQIPELTKSVTSADSKSKQMRTDDGSSRITLQSDGPRNMSQMSSIGRQGRLGSIFPEPDVEPSLHKISFLEQPPEVIPDLPDEEVQEAPGIEPAEFIEGDAQDEVPEDMPDDQTGDDGDDSAPFSSAPDTADMEDDMDMTDVEDDANFQGTTGDEDDGD